MKNDRVQKLQTRKKENLRSGAVKHLTENKGEGPDWIREGARGYSTQLSPLQKYEENERD